MKAFAVYPCKVKDHPWKVDGKLGGKRLRRFFKVKKEAEVWAMNKNEEVNAYGDTAALPDNLRIQALTAHNMLHPIGATVLEAAEYYVKRKSVLARSVPMNHLCREIENDFISKVTKGESSSDHLQGIRKAGKLLTAAFRDKFVSEIQTHEIVAWIESFTDLSATTRDYYRRYAGVIFAWAIQRGYCDKNPCHGIPSMAKKGKIEILTPDEVDALLRNCHPSMVPFYSLGVFAGLRPMSELMRLTWDKIHWDDRVIDVENVKTVRHGNSARNRYVSMTDNLIAWLPHEFAGTKEKMVPGNWRDHVYGTRGSRKISFPSDREKAISHLKSVGKPFSGLADWPMDAMRHTYASWHYSLGQDAAKTAASMGNSAAVVFSNYNRKLKPEEAKRYLEIYP